MRPYIYAGVAVLLILPLVIVVVRVASGQTQIGLGGKDVRVPLEWLSAMPARPGQLGSGDFGRKLKLDGKNRFYEIHVPPNYDPARPTPLVFVFHGGGSYPAAVRYESRMTEVADAQGFIVVFPGGTGISKLFDDRLLIWNDGRPLKDGSPNKVDDVGFVKMILAEMEKSFNIDPQRIYSAGYSNGAQFTYRLGKELSNKFAAIATVAGHRPATGDVIEPPARPISVMQISGMQDTIGPYKGGVPSIKAELQTKLLPVADVIRSWAEFDGCGDKPASSRTIGKAIEHRFGPGKDGTEVVLWSLQDGGHTWPSGNVMPSSAAQVGHVNQDIFAAEQMWAFFQAHPLPEKYLGK